VRHFERDAAARELIGSRKDRSSVAASDQFLNSVVV